MFTGLVRERGRLIAAPEPSDEGGVLLRIGHSGELGGELEIGASLAVSGVCLTLVEHGREACAVELSPETLRRTTLGEREPGATINLELPLRPSDRLGGHFVQGHVDAVTELVERREQGDDVILEFRTPEALRGQIVEKGSVALDGVSMTVVHADDERFTVAVIPHTLEVTTLGVRRPGERVNVEGDVLAKYVAALVRPEGAAS